MLRFNHLPGYRHCYRPYRYSDWEKKPGDNFYTLKCPPCYVEKPKPRVIVAKECKICSFWQQMFDNCRGKPWHPPVYSKEKPKPLVEKCTKMLQRKGYPLQNGSETVGGRISTDFKIQYCDEVPDCPEPNWKRKVK